MEHAHEGPQTAEKESAPRARRNAPKQVPSGAGGMLDLQRAAGNQAVAKMLAGRAIRRPAPRAQDPSTQPATPVSLQRHTLTAAMQGVKPSLQDYDFKAIAENILGPQTTPAVQSPTQKPPTTTTDSSGKTTTPTAGEAATKAAQPIDWSIPSAEALATREKRLKGDLSPEEKDRLAKKEELDLLETTKGREKSLEEREKKLKHVETDEERALREREEDITRQEEEKKLEEREKKVKHQETPEEKRVREREEDVARQEEAKNLEEREKKLKHELTPEEKALRDKKDELDDLEAQKQKDEATRQTRRKAEKARQSLKRVDWSKVPGNSRF